MSGLQIGLIIGSYIFVAFIVQTLLYREDQRQYEDHGTPPSPGLCIFFGLIWPVTAIIFGIMEISEKINEYRKNHPHARTLPELYLDGLSAILPPWEFKKKKNKDTFEDEVFYDVHDRYDAFLDDNELDELEEHYRRAIEDAMHRDYQHAAQQLREVLDGRDLQAEAVIMPEGVEYQEEDLYGTDEDLPY